MTTEPDFDVAVVGAGPAGLSAARAAAATGARTVVLDRAEHPRYKTCGGGLVGASLSVATPLIQVPGRDTISAITFTDNGHRAFTRHATGPPLLTMVRRDDFDHAWLKAAVSAGAEARQNTLVRGLDQDAEAATITLSDGAKLTARVVIGADGSAGVTSRYVGVHFAQRDLGLEVELAATPEDRAAWHGRVQLDWGTVPGSYGWVFPKMKVCEVHGADRRSAECWSEDDELTVGVIMAKGKGAETKEYLTRFLAHLGLSEREVRRDSGHLTRCRTDDAPLARGRVLVAGDAAGLLEPWTREGISYALRSGTWAGEIAARAARDGVGALDGYPALISKHLTPEMTAGRRLLNVFAKHRHLVHAAMATPPGWRAFESFCRGDITMAGVMRRPQIRVAVNMLGGEVMHA